MINQGKFAERLKKVMEHYAMTAANLAAKIEVQRSSISHILSGRNKPSLEFVMKVLKEFPEVELYWLLNGTGTFPKEVESPTPTVSSASGHAEKSNDSNKSVMPLKMAALQDSREIERIVIFYKDGSFKDYRP